jgi:SlyX protein
MTLRPTPQDAAFIDAERLTALEIKASFSEDLLDKLDQTIIRQQTQIDALIHEVLYLRQQLGNPEQVGRGNLRDDLPPHY